MLALCLFVIWLFLLSHLAITLTWRCWPLLIWSGRGKPLTKNVFFCSLNLCKWEVKGIYQAPIGMRGRGWASELEGNEILLPVSTVMELWWVQRGSELLRTWHPSPCLWGGHRARDPCVPGRVRVAASLWRKETRRDLPLCRRTNRMWCQRNKS